MPSLMGYVWSHLWQMSEPAVISRFVEFRDYQLQGPLHTGHTIISIMDSFISSHPVSNLGRQLELFGMKRLCQTDILTFCVTVRSLRTCVATSLYLVTSLVLVTGWYLVTCAG